MLETEVVKETESIEKIIINIEKLMNEAVEKEKEYILQNLETINDKNFMRALVYLKLKVFKNLLVNELKDLTEVIKKD